MQARRPRECHIAAAGPTRAYTLSDGPARDFTVPDRPTRLARVSGFLGPPP